MLSDIIRPHGTSCSNIPDLTTSLYLSGSQNLAATLTTLDSVTLPASVFSADGDFMDFMYSGSFAGDNATEVFLYFGTDALFDSEIIDPANETWALRGRMVRTGPTTQYTTATLITSSLQVNKLSSTSITFGPAIALELKANATNAGDVTLSAGFRQFFFQNR